MRVIALAISVAVIASTPATALEIDPVTGRFGPVKVLTKKAWRSGDQSAFLVSYKIDGKTYRNAKVYCARSSVPIYRVERLDRGDGRKLDMLVGGVDGHSGLLTDLAPGYMNWAIDVWAQTCL